jgi:GT2 family glycosyltransferase
VAPRISFVVPVRDDAVRLDTCLRSILRNRPTPAEIEIVVADNGSVDGSPEVARRLGARVSVIENARVSELRNRAAREATGDILAFVDADNEIVSGWVPAAIETLEMADVAAAGALYVPPSDGTWVQRAYGLLRGRTQVTGDVEWLGSGNLAVWRHAFEAVQGFDVSLEACEDVDLCARLRARGLRVVADPRIGSVHHGDPKTLGVLFRSELWRGRDNLRVSLRRPIAWGALPSAMIPIVDAAMIGVGVAGLLGLLVAWRPALSLTTTAGIVIVGGALLKLARAAAREGGASAFSLLQGFLVALVYDVARALALVAKAPHRRASPHAATAAS